MISFLSWHRFGGERFSNRILFRITLPFTVLFAGVTLISWVASNALISHFLDMGLKMQLVRVANGISRSGFLLNPVVLTQVKGMIDADIVLSDPEGRVLTSTLDGKALNESSTIHLLAYPEEGTQGKMVRLGGSSYRVVFNAVALPDRSRAYLSLWQSAKSAIEFERSIQGVTGVLSLAGIVALGVAGLVIARSITTPVVELARISERVATGDFRFRAAICGNDEIAQLGHSFNTMIARLHESERKLVEAEKLAVAGQLAAGVAHEIRNPLTAIKMFVQVLQRRLAGDEKNQETLAVLLSEIDRLDRIVEQIVQRARPDDGLRLEPTDLVTLIDEVLTVGGEAFRAGQITLAKQVVGDIPMVAVDRAKIKQVLWNVIVNAKDAMPHGGELTVRIRHHGEGETVEMVFEDTGMGLAAGMEPERCFDSFFTTKPEGMGLGLAMSRKIVARHGGRIALSRRPTGGVAVSVSLPCAG